MAKTRFTFSKCPKCSAKVWGQTYPVIKLKCDSCKKTFIPDESPSRNGVGIIDKAAECFEKDPSYVRKLNPKYVRFRDGHRERYDPSKHC